MQRNATHALCLSVRSCLVVAKNDAIFEEQRDGEEDSVKEHHTITQSHGELPTREVDTGDDQRNHNEEQQDLSMRDGAGGSIIGEGKRTIGEGSQQGKAVCGMV